jgi:hypothetical protein
MRDLIFIGNQRVVRGLKKLQEELGLIKAYTNSIEANLECITDSILSMKTDNGISS